MVGGVVCNTNHLAAAYATDAINYAMPPILIGWKGLQRYDKRNFWVISCVHYGTF